MKQVYLPSRREWQQLIARPLHESDKLEEFIESITKQIVNKGDTALRELSALYDGANLKTLSVGSSEICKRARLVPDELKQAMSVAIDNISSFHQHCSAGEQEVESIPGVRCWSRAVPLESVGLYVPGGSAPLFSTLLMLAVPAGLAGCDQVVVSTPPDSEGKLAPVIAAAAELLEISEVHLIGGAQAIIAMAVGTESVPAVDKIFGPGNQYVTAAKQYAQSKLGVAIDLPAGPSELLVIADCTANSQYLAADLLSQAEHGADSQVVIVSDSRELLDCVQEQIDLQLSTLPRKEIASSALANGLALQVTDIKEAIEFSNFYAPEHLILALDDAESLALDVRHAGSVFLGRWTPESLGDYASGTNHTLPTNRAARYCAGVSVESFLKRITFQSATKSGLLKLGRLVTVMARAEGLEGHARSILIRTELENRD